MKKYHPYHYMLYRIFPLFFLYFSISAQITTHINSGDPAYPFPQFLPYENRSETLHNVGTKSPCGVSHAEMEKSTREAFQIMMNRAEYPGGGVGNTKYIYYPSNPSCSEGTGYAMLAAAIMVDKTTFDGLWLWAHDNAMNLVNRYDNGQPTSPGYLYSRLPGWQNAAGGNSAADGDFDIAMALLIAYKQWGEFMGIEDSEGNPISYKKDLIEFLKGLTDTIPYAPSNGSTLISGDIGLDGYFKGGDSWNELTDWATQNQPFHKRPEHGSPDPQHIDYTCPAYFHEFADFLESEDSAKYAWNIYQFKRAEASSDWLMGQLYAQNQKNIPMVGWVELSEDNEATFTSFSDGEDFRASWRTILHYVWHGNPQFSWDPEQHAIIPNQPNSHEKEMGLRYAKFLWDTRQSPWNNTGVTGTTGNYWGPHVLFYYYTPQGSPMSVFNLNWLHGTGAPSAVISQDFDLMAEMYRHAEIEWDITDPGDRYLTSVPHYFHGFYRVLAMTLMTGNHQAPSKIKPIANMKVYLDVDKTFAYEGDTLTYTIDYRNYGAEDAQDVSITDTLPKDFSFVSSTQGGTYNSGSHTVTWNIGTVPGVKSATGIPPTVGQVSLKACIENATKKQYANRASISCSNGYGWVSDEFPNTISPVMKRNLVDIAKRALIIEKSASVYKVNPGKDVIFSIHFSNSSEAGFINGGRSGIRFSYSHGGTPAFEARHKMRVRMFHDAQEAYVNYGNYRISYYLFDPGRTGIVDVNGNTNGWVVNLHVLEGLERDRMKILHQNITPGSDVNGKWNQRIILQFSDPLDTSVPDTNWATMGATTRHLEKHHGSSNRIHRGQTAPLRIEWDIATTGGVMAQWDDDWSWDPNAGSTESQHLGFPITPDFTDPDPNNPGIPVNKLNPKHCESVNYTVDNVLIEEWDGYTWRRVFGTSPMPGRDIENVKIIDTIPSEFTFKEFVGEPPLGISPSISGNIISWEIPLLQINQGGTISYRATAGDIAPLTEKKVLNYSWIEGKNESPAYDTAVVIITTDSVPPQPPPPTTMHKFADKKVYYNGDTINYLVTYKQTHGSIVSGPTKPDDWKLITGSTKLPIDQDGTIEYAYGSTVMVHQYAHGVNGIVQGTFHQQPYHEFSLIARQSKNDYVEIWFKQEYADLSIQFYNSSEKIGPLHKITYPDFPEPFSFKLQLKEDTAFLWIDDIGTSLPGIVQTGIDIRQGYVGVKVMNDVGEKLSGWYSHFDSAFDLRFVDLLQFGIRMLSTSGEVITGVLAGTDLQSQMSGDTIVWPVISGPTPIPYGDSLYFTIQGIVDTSLSPFIVNTAYAHIYGHHKDSIGAQVISLYGSNVNPVTIMADPPGGTFTDSVRVTLLASASDVEIVYTTNGTVPDPNDIGAVTKTYTASLLFTQTTTLTAVAHRNGTIVSDTLQEVYLIISGAPDTLVAIPPGCTFRDFITVQLEASDTTLQILYTTDGSIPNPADIGSSTKVYSASLTFHETTLLIACGFRNDTAATNTVLETYSKVSSDTLVAIPPGCMFKDFITVQLEASDTTLQILYTTDGSIPDPADIGSSTKVYSASLTFHETTLLIACGFRNDTAATNTVQETYSKVVSDTLVAIPPGRTFTDFITVKLEASDIELQILYTTDGSIPDPTKIGSSTEVYSASLTFHETTLLIACGFRDDTAATNTVQETYRKVFSVIRAKYQDLNGNGHIDAASLEFETSPGILPDSGYFTSPFDASDNVVVFKSTMAFDNSSANSRITVRFPREFDFDGSTAFTEDKYGIIFGAAYDGSSFSIADGIAPVITKAKYKFENPLSRKRALALSDTLIVSFSETVKQVTHKEPFLLISLSTNYSFELSQLNGSGDEALFMVEEINGVSCPSSGDSIYINYQAGVSDMLGNAQEYKDNRRALLIVDTIPISLDIDVFPNPTNLEKEIPAPLLEGFSKRRGVLIRIDPHNQRVPMNAQIQIVDAVGNKVAFYSEKSGVLSNIEIKSEKEENRIVFLWDGSNTNGRKVGNGVYIGIISVTINTNQKYQKKVSIGIQE